MCFAAHSICKCPCGAKLLSLTWKSSMNIPSLS
jgi:hypothetical protein